VQLYSVALYSVALYRIIRAGLLKGFALTRYVSSSPLKTPAHKKVGRSPTWQSPHIKARNLKTGVHLSNRETSTLKESMAPVSQSFYSGIVHGKKRKVNPPATRTEKIQPKKMYPFCGFRGGCHCPTKTTISSFFCESLTLPFHGSIAQ